MDINICLEKDKWVTSDIFVICSPLLHHSLLLDVPLVIYLYNTLSKIKVTEII